MKDRLCFYEVNEEYIKYLQEGECKVRGFTRVPNIRYEIRKKFVFGIVLSINNFNYYAPVSSYRKSQKDNILIKDKKGNVLGSIRFNYMIPVNSNDLTRKEIGAEPDPKYKVLLEKEYAFCLKNQETIRNKARRTYNNVIKGLSPTLMKNSCDFKLLEQLCMDYEVQQEVAATE